MTKADSAGGIKRLSIIVPVYNEAATLREIISRIEAVELPGIESEVIFVDDGSTDGSQEILGEIENHRVLLHEKNSGKGKAIQTGLAAATGEYLLIQDADLEYDPRDILKLLRPILDGRARVVYGSRFTGERKNMFFHHYLGNRLLTLLTNVLYNTTLSDMETCYKLAPTDLLREIRIKSHGFNVEPEMTAKILKRRVRIYEVPISYTGREFEEGKKISWQDGFAALFALIYYRFFD